MRPDVIELRIPSKAEWVSVARLAIAGVASRLDFSVEDIEDLKLAVAEACTNCVQHAADRDEVRIACEISQNEIKITVEDKGAGAVNGAQQPPAQSGEPKVGGLGVFLIRSIMDEVTYDVRQGTKLVMTKHVRK